MVTVSPSGFNALTASNTLALFKRPSSKAAESSAVTPSIEIASQSHFSAIADLASKLIDLKKSNIDGDTPTSKTVGAAQANANRDARDMPVGADRMFAIMQAANVPVSPDLKPGTAEFKAAEQARMTAQFDAVEADIVSHFDEYVTAAIANNSQYKDDPAFQAALKSGSMTIERGEQYGMKSTKASAIFDEDGYAIGSSVGGWDGKYDQSALQIKGSDMVLTSNGKTAFVGSIQGKTFVVSW